MKKKPGINMRNICGENIIVAEGTKKEWVEDPIAVIADKLNKNNHQIIADLGCGMNQLKTLVSSYSQWYSFDHYSDDDTVIKADVSDLKEYLQDNSVDAAVFCMSLWGTNYMDYIKEAYRYLNYGGIVQIRLILLIPGMIFLFILKKSVIVIKH